MEKNWVIERAQQMVLIFDPLHAHDRIHTDANDLMAMQLAVLIEIYNKLEARS